MMANMLRYPLVALVAFLSFSALAAESDLAATLLEAPDAALPGEVWKTRGSVKNLGPEAATNVTVTVTAGMSQCETKIDSFPVGETREVSCEGSFPVDAAVYLLPASVYAQHFHDPVYENNTAYKFVKAITPPDLYAWSYSLTIPEPGLPFTLHVYYDNKAQQASTSTVLTVDAPNGFGTLPANCTANGNRATCNLGTLEPPEGFGYPTPDQIELQLIAPDVSEHQFNVTTMMSAAEEDARPADNTAAATMQTYRTFNVINNADAGSGSLRAAMEAANAGCMDGKACLIAFRIPAGANAWHSIALQSPLPRVVTRVFIDGTTQRGYFGDTNSAGPEVEISGDLLEEGSGIEMQCGNEVRGLAINGFPDNGISLVDSSSCGAPNPVAATGRAIRENYIGVDPTGTRAVPNLRGVRINAPGWLVDGNIISGNTRAGVFVARGAAHIRNNRIGLDVHNQPLGNGAAGVFIGTAASGSDVSDNYIGFNHEFGVAIAGDAHYVSANRNSLQGNYQQGIDWGLDGTVVTSAIALPIITSVRFEDGRTIVEGTTTAVGTFSPAVTVYANDAPDPSGYGEGQYVLGEVRATYGEPYNAPMRFTFVYPGDLRGKWITATATHQYYIGWLKTPGTISTNDDTGWGYFTTTSEFSRAYEFN
jgi:hypothetical protein